MFLFFHNIDVSYKCFVIDKNFISPTRDIHDSLLQQIVGFLLSKSDELSAFDKLKVYYDNGQSKLTYLLREAFSVFASRTEFIPDVNPAHYRLFQVADITCTLELARAKLLSHDALSMSELVFFGGVKKLKKNYLKLLGRHCIH